MDNYGSFHEAVGCVVEYVDPVGDTHEAIITAVWGNGPEALGVNPINLVYVVKDTAMTDSCGRQIERATSVQAAGPTAAHGRFYRSK